MRRRFFLAAIAVILLTESSVGLERRTFEQPPPSDRPWVYWFWKNGNISKEGITADLEAMARVGIGGVIMMEVALSVPPGPISFFSPEWKDQFTHAVAEAHRLGVSISVNSAPGWTGSGGPWVSPEQSMQKVVCSETVVTGPVAYDEQLPLPEIVQGFYRDIAVLAFPTPPKPYRIEEIQEKALYERGPYSSKPNVRPSLPSIANYEEPTLDAVIDRESICDISAMMTDDGKLTWTVPEDNWTILRFGHTSTGQTNRPAPLPGLECDKLDTDALDAHFRSFSAALLDVVGPENAKSIVATHLDSWEVGAQNWTRRFREEFQSRRSYDLLPYLPVMTGRVVESLEISERFLWDLRQTVSDLIVENHGKHLRELAMQHGLWFSVEPYDMTPCDDMTLGATGDVPMCEFWSKGFDTRYSVKEATSVAHVYGKPVVAAEAFTSIDRWLFHPALLKAQGDWAFGEGVNRFVIHRYVHQPFMQARPGLSLGPHGVHYERTETWWEYTKPWHEYLARCQHVLRQGHFVADILYLSPEGAPNVFVGPDPAPLGYKFDACTPEALLTRVTVDHGRLTLPEGATYQVLVLPIVETMTPALLERVQELIDAGVTVIGAPPVKSPSLSGYPDGDTRVREISARLWSNENITSGRVIAASDFGRSVYTNGPPDDMAQAHWIWSAEGDPSTPPPPEKRYFRRVVTVDEGATLASARITMTADNAFKVFVNNAEAVSGEDYNQFYSGDITRLLQPGANVIAVIAENRGAKPNAAGLIGSVLLRYNDGREVVVHTDSEWLASLDATENWTRETEARGWASARDLGIYGTAPWGKVGVIANRTGPYPESEQVEAVLRGKSVAPDFEADKPLTYAHRVDGDTDVYFVANGGIETVESNCVFRVTGKTAELWHPEDGSIRGLGSASVSSDGRTVIPLRFESVESYFIVFRPKSEPDSLDKSALASFPSLSPVMEIAGPWEVSFDPAAGGPKNAVPFERLDDWSLRPEEDIRYYSGTATYRCTFTAPTGMIEQKGRLLLDFGRVEVVASGTLNGKGIGVAWKAPHRLDVTDAVRPGENVLVIRVANLWPNRMIGDEFLPADSDRTSNGTLKEWPEWLLQGKPSPTGRHSFAAWRHWAKDDSLITSGLLGSVTLLREESTP